MEAARPESRESEDATPPSTADSSSLVPSSSRSKRRDVIDELQAELEQEDTVAAQGGKKIAPQRQHVMDLSKDAREKEWRENPLSRGLMRGWDEADSETIVATMLRMPNSDMVQEAGCWALKDLAMRDDSAGMAEVLSHGAIEVTLTALNTHSKSFPVQFRGFQLLVALAVNGVDDWEPHDASTRAPVNTAVAMAINRGGGVRLARDAIAMHGMGRVADRGDGKGDRYIHSEVQEWAWRLQVMLGQPDHYHVAELPYYVPATLAEETYVTRQTNQIGKIVRDAMASNRSLGGQSLDSIEAVFKAIDADGSGDLDHEEFTEAMNRLGLGLTPDQIIQCIEVLDVDGDGEVSLEEFMVLVREPVKKAVKVIAAASAFTSAGKMAEAKRAF